MSGENLKVELSDKQALAHFHKWAKKRKKPCQVDDFEYCALRQKPCHVCGQDVKRLALCFVLANVRADLTIDNFLPTCACCKLAKPNEDFDPIEHAKRTLRRSWRRTPMAQLAIQKARVAMGKWRCAHCNELFGEKGMDLDHIEPIVPTGVVDQTLDEYARRLYCAEPNLQYLCKGCHKTKTKAENASRPKKPRKNKLALQHSARHTESKDGSLNERRQDDQKASSERDAGSPAGSHEERRERGVLEGNPNRA